MGGFAHRAQSEPLYRKCLAALTNEELEIELRCIRGILKTSLNGPHYGDVWKLDCLKDEFTKRGLIPSGGF